MSIQKSYEQEVIELHQFFQVWLGGMCEESDQIFERVAQVLSEQFSMVGPMVSKPPVNRCCKVCGWLMGHDQDYVSGLKPFKVTIEREG